MPSGLFSIFRVLMSPYPQPLPHRDVDPDRCRCRGRCASRVVVEALVEREPKAAREAQEDLVVGVPGPGGVGRCCTSTSIDSTGSSSSGVAGNLA
jgi:hypothetical protein